MTYQHLIVRREGPVEYVELNRPEVRNALNPELLAELGAWARRTGGADRPRVAVLSGQGKVFCAGADVNWMAAVVDYTRDENARDAAEMARTFLALDTLPMPLVARVHGAAIGGGAGLAAVCDIVVAEDSAMFGFTEVRLGILPSVIGPYVVSKIGASAARELFLTGSTFSAGRAVELGLVHVVVAADALDQTIERYVGEIIAGGPEAIRTAKTLIRQIARLSPADALPLTAETIAERRVSPEGQEGLRAFLEKRKPSWIAGASAGKTSRSPE
jgi:methylglutaconyl-CoA hydratase